MEKQGASHPCPRVLHPCHPAMLLREEWRGWWLLCASMSMSMRGNLMHGTSCHHHHDDELFVCQCVLQPAIPLCVCMCVCVQRARQCRQQQQEEHTRPKEKRRENVCVCEEEERETASQMNQPTNQVKQRAYVCVKKK